MASRAMIGAKSRGTGTRGGYPKAACGKSPMKLGGKVVFRNSIGTLLILAIGTCHAFGECNLVDFKGGNCVTSEGINKTGL